MLRSPTWFPASCRPSAVKGNQPTLYQGIMDYSEEHLADDFARIDVRRFATHEQTHGRDSERTYFLCRVPDELADRALGET